MGASGQSRALVGFRPRPRGEFMAEYRIRVCRPRCVHAFHKEG
jgi:hypothetical protein